MRTERTRRCWFCSGEHVSKLWFLFRDNSGLGRDWCENCASTLEAFITMTRNSDAFSLVAQAGASG
jgi:hypothetical protein